MENNNSTFLNQCNYELKTSTPGKILICGGYLIINPRYSGLVLTTDTKINCTCVFLKSVQIEKENCPQNIYDNLFALIEIISIDFQLNYVFKIHLVKQSSNLLTIRIDQLQGENNNYIYFSIFYSIYFYLSKIWQDNDSSKIIEIFKILKTNVIRLSINSDYRFYTYNKNEFFYNSKKSFSIKTGLGSSSALISSIVTCLYSFLNVTFNQKNELNLNRQNQRLSEINKDDLTFILIASTIANNMAQNKIGSGFDIISCLLGSQIFKRYKINEENQKLFEVIQGCANIDNSSLNKIKFLSDNYKDKVINKLNYIQIPEYLKCCLISIECGSDTRLLVSKLMKWAEDNKINEIFDDDLFQNINRINLELIKQFENLNYSSIEEFSKSQEKNIIKELCYELRNYIKILSNNSGVEIEPDVLTQLLDSLMENDIIITGICPGAGGYDGVFVMGYGDSFVSTVKQVLEKFNEKSDSFKAYYIPLEIDDRGTTICCEYI